MYARAVDITGNRSGTIVKSFIADNTKPVIAATYLYDNIIDYKGDASISVAVTDKGAGVRSISFQIGKDAPQVIDLTKATYSSLTNWL